MAKTFSDAINEIMPLVKERSDLPFAITREDGKWTINYFSLNTTAAHEEAKAQADEYLAFLRESDPLTAIFKGADFSDGSFAFVRDTVLYARLREEYHVMRSSGKDTDEIHALTCFMQDHIGEFSHKAADYLTTLDRPLAALAEMCPYSMTTDNLDWTYDEDLAFDAIHYIENEVKDRLRGYPGERLNEPRCFNGYEETQSVTIDKTTIALAENLKADSPYLVCNIGDDGETYNHSAFPGYISAMREFLARQTALIDTLEAERESRKERGVDSSALTAAHCVPGSDKDDFTGRLIIVKASELSPQYRCSDSQLVQCSHGNGARPKAIGTSVFGKELYSGASVVYGRHQILGVADEEKLPQWAKAKLEIQRDPTVFEFKGFHFKPYRSFRYGEVDRQLEGDSRLWKTDAKYQLRNMRNDREMRTLRSDALYTEFYNTANNSTADIFVCVENSKLYVPGNSALFHYTEPSEKELRVAENKALKEYGNVIDAAISEGVEQKSVPRTLEILDARFGKAKTDELLATVALTSLKNDGRISNSRREWAKSVIGDAGGLKTINVQSHPAYFDNLMMYAVHRGTPEQEQVKSTPKVKKHSILDGLDEAKDEAARYNAENKGEHAKKKNRGEQQEV